ncbi:MAG: 2-dehydropantoate 2-reductase [Acidimicrobiales bacterium]
MTGPRTAVIGPGAVGLVVAAALVEAGSPPLVGARSAFDAVTIDTGAGERTHPLDVRTDPATVGGPVDVVFLATKVYQTDAAAGWLRALCGTDTVVAVCQNGIDQRERLGRYVADDRIAPVVVNLPAERHGPGRVATIDRAAVAVADDAAGRRVAAALDGSFLTVQLTDDWWSQAWIKLLINSSTGIIGVLSGAPNGVVAEPDAAALLRALIDEAAAVGRAAGAVIPHDIADRITHRILTGAPDHRSSIATDRLAGRPTEWEARNKVVVDLADRHGIEVPLHRAGTTLIRLGEPGIAAS